MEATSDSTLFTYALLMMDGVGRVTAARLLKHFAVFDDLLSYPREQVLTRLKGTPSAESLVNRLFGRTEMRTMLARADEDLRALAERSVRVTCPRDPEWPPGLNDLPPAERPVLLYSYGNLAALSSPLLGLFAHPPLSGPAYEEAQTLVSKLLPEGVTPLTGASTGFDVVMHKLANLEAARPSALVAPCGLGKLPAPLRPWASAAVKAGGVVVSTFSMGHGPFPHDEKERALVQAALCRTSVFVETTPEHPEWAALTWAAEAGRAVFAYEAEGTALPEGVRRLGVPDDAHSILESLRNEAPGLA